MKKFIGILILVSLIAVANTAFAAELKVGSRLYTKFLSKNTFDAAEYVTTGNGVGARSELELTLDGKVSDRCEMGGRILTVWDPSGFPNNYSDWGSNGWDTSAWYDAKANLWQVRGMWLKFYPATIPTVKSVLFGSSDRGMFNEWTIGKSRWIDRDNAKIIYAEGAIGAANYGIATFPMGQQKWMAPNWDVGDSERSDWGTGLNLAFSPTQAINLKVNASHLLAVNMDPLDETKATTRFDNAVETLEIGFQPNPVYNINGLVGYSTFSYDVATSTPAWPVPHANVSGLALKVRALADDPLGVGLTLKGEVFDVSQDFVSIYAPRIEGDVLLTEGHIRYAKGGGQTGSTWAGRVTHTPSPVPTDEFTDWNEAHNESVMGKNGITFIPEFRRGALGVKGEVSMMSNKLNSQNVDLTKYPYVVTTEYDESWDLMAIRADYLLPIRNGINVFGKYKVANWSNKYDSSIATDDYSKADTEIYAGASYQLTDELGLTGGYKTLGYVDKGNGTDKDVKTYELSAGMVFAEVKYNVGGVDIGIAYEKVDGEDKVTSDKVKDMRLKGTVEVKI